MNKVVFYGMVSTIYNKHDSIIKKINHEPEYRQAGALMILNLVSCLFLRNESVFIDRQVF